MTTLTPTAPTATTQPRRFPSTTLKAFMVIVIAHWGEHLSQAFQIYALGWTPKEARGILGIWFPWLISSELMHYGYALVMITMIWFLRREFTGLSRQYWMLGFSLQFWHHIEHLLLLIQAIIGRNLADSPVPVSLLQFFIPRVELHLFYNTIVTIPLVLALLAARRDHTPASP